MRIPNGGGGRNHADLAWQIIAGSDYYWTPSSARLSNINYLDLPVARSIPGRPAYLGQHLVGAGVRFHF